MTFPVLNKPYKLISSGYTHIIIFREDKGEYFTYDSELISPNKRVFGLNKWEKYYLEVDVRKFTPLFRTAPIEDDPEYKELFI